MDNSPVEVSWPELTRARRALVVVDVVESVRLMQAHEADVIDRWRRFVHEVQTQVLPPRGGRLVKSLGDGMLLEFESVPSAVAAALEMQKRIAPYNVAREASAAMYLRMGVHVSEVVVDELDVYGAGVNLAARLSTLAGPGELVASASVRDELVAGLDARVTDLGECFLKHYEEPVRAFQLSDTDDGASPDVAVPAPVQQPSVAVVPFHCSGDGARGAAYGDLIAEGVISSIACSPALHVISRLSTQAFRGRVSAPADVGSCLGATYVLSGVCEVLGDRMVVIAELAHSRDARVIWSQRLVAPVLDLVATDSELLSAIVNGVQQAVLNAETLKAQQQPLPSLDASSAFVGAVSLLHRQSLPDYLRARELLELLVERYPRQAAPRAWLAKWFAVGAAQGWSGAAQLSVQWAVASVSQALQADPGNALAWAIKGLLHGYVEKDFAQARGCLERALQSNPSEPLAWLYLGSLHGWLGEGAEATRCAEKALQLSPLDPMRYYFDSLAAGAMLGAGRYAPAIAHAQRSIEENRAHVATYKVLTMAQMLSGHEASASRTARELMAREPGFSIARFRSVSPWAASPDVQRLCHALHEAGVPMA